MKINRDTFLYLAPRFAPKSRWAQCSTCRDWVSGDRKCVIHGPKVNVVGGASCGLYVWGVPRPAGTETRAKVTPEESGLVVRDVRCQNCRWFDDADGECEFFRLLNEKLPDVFDLDVKVDKLGCCNAQQPNEEGDEP
jgi:hypothetical protein